MFINGTALLLLRGKSTNRVWCPVRIYMDHIEVHLSKEMPCTSVEIITLSDEVIYDVTFCTSMELIRTKVKKLQWNNNSNYDLFNHLILMGLVESIIIGEKVNINKVLLDRNLTYIIKVVDNGTEDNPKIISLNIDYLMSVIFEVVESSHVIIEAPNALNCMIQIESSNNIFVKYGKCGILSIKSYIDQPIKTIPNTGLINNLVIYTKEVKHTMQFLNELGYRNIYSITLAGMDYRPIYFWTKQELSFMKTLIRDAPLFVITLPFNDPITISNREDLLTNIKIVNVNKRIYNPLELLISSI